jgi:branched-chain amino acid transport system permease protein
MDNLIVALFEIISFGAIVVLVVLGLGIIASMMGIFNFAPRRLHHLCRV